YGFTASAYITGIIEHLFGIGYDAMKERIHIEPRIPKALYGKAIALSDLILPSGNGTRLSVQVRQTAARQGRIAVAIAGELPRADLEFTLPGSVKTVRVPAQRTVAAKFP